MQTSLMIRRRPGAGGTGFKGGIAVSGVGELAIVNKASARRVIWASEELRWDVHSTIETVTVGSAPQRVSRY